MCTCASCSYTDKFRQAGFAEWPRGNPAGPRKSKADYAAHVRHSQQWGRSPNGNMHHAPEISASVLKGAASSGGSSRYERPASRYPGDAAAKAGLKAYVVAFERLNGLKPVPLAKRVPYLVALARELRQAAV